MLQRTRASLADERGFTLVEVLATVVLIAIVVAPLAGLVVSNVRSATLARAHLRASYLAQMRIEELRATSFDSIVSEPEAAIADAETFTRAVAVVSQPTVAEQLLGLPGRLKRVTVTVTWDSGKRSVQLATLISGGQTP